MTFQIVARRLGINCLLEIKKDTDEDYDNNVASYVYSIYNVYNFNEIKIAWKPK